MPHPTITALRSLVDTRFPVATRKPGGAVATGVAAIDNALGGGLPTGRLTEITSPHPGSGGQLLLCQLLLTMRAARQRVALVDAMDGFTPESVPDDALRHLVWVRPKGLSDALVATDVLVRDGNYGLVALDLRGIAERELQSTPKGVWHRLHRAAEDQPTAVLVQTTVGLVPAVLHRLELRSNVGLAGLRRTWTELLAGLTVETVRGRYRQAEELAG